MKVKHKLILACAVALGLALPAVADEPANIIIINPKADEVIHRNPQQVPITCVCLSQALEVSFLSNLGAVSVEIENETTGEYTHTVVNAVAGPMVFPISGNAGFWTITFTLSNGAVYYGDFVI